MMSSRSLSNTGNLDRPVSKAWAIRSETCVALCKASTSTLGINASTAVLSLKRNERVSSETSSGSNTLEALSVISVSSSSEVREVSISSLGSTPNRRTTELAVPMSSRTKGRTKTLYPASRGTNYREVASGAASAMYFGTCSPMIK